LALPGLVFRHDVAAHQLVFLGMSGTVVAASRAPGDQWENVTDTAALAAVQRNTTSAGVVLGETVPDQMPQTVFFKTPAGRLGLLQVIRLMQQPAELQFHYQWLQK